MLWEISLPFWLWQLLGRMHPLVVHFPIGLLVTAFFLETLTLRGRRPELRAGITWLVNIGAGTALLAAAQGWLLALEDYGGTLVAYHRWLGTATAVLALFAALLLARAQRKAEPLALRGYRAALLLSVVCLSAAGHLGASLTHGSDYLTGVLPFNKDRMPGESRAVLEEFVQVKKAGGVSQVHLNRLNLQVRAIFAHNCYRCHSSDKSKADLVLDSKEGVMRGGESGPILIPGDADASEIIRRLRLPRDHEEAMPSEGKALEEEEIELIRLWIDAGAPWTDQAVKTFREAELALHKPPLPTGPATLANPVDRFVNAYFEAQGIPWPEPVGDAVFIRRAYLDLIGLLPEPEEVEAFLADPAPGKRARLVDELLGREHAYAQHWLSFWNDLLRNDYSGTGFITGGRKQITPWLYAALVDNKPYDEMVRELISPTAASEGFIRGIEWRGTVNASQRTEMQAAQNISQSLLGLNLKCASCHNSFVSNLTLDQAYAFANVFADTVLQIYRCDKPTGRWATTGFIYPELGDVDGGLPKAQRLARLADLLTKPENGRLYRTMVNRLWARLMGRGLVEPVDEMDNLPWNQELLDYLAADLIDHGYDLKHVLQTLMHSRTYGLPSVSLKDASEVTAEDFVFRGPLRRRLSAEQFADALSQVVSPVYYSVAFDPFDVRTQAEWIWYDAEQDGRKSLPEPGTYYFRHAFDLPRREVAAAELLVSVDHAFRLYLNGEELGRGRDWRQVHRLDATEHLKGGANLLAVEAENEGTVPNPAGILLSLKVSFRDGGEQRVTSDRAWKVTERRPDPGWEQLAYDAQTWVPVRSFGSHTDNRYWGRLLGFTHEPSGHPLRFARASLVENNPFLKALGRPSRDIVITDRNEEATLLQALELTNGAFLNEAAARGAEYWLAQSGAAPEVLIRKIYQRAFARAPTRAEMEAAVEMLGPSPDAEAVQDLLWAVVLLPEFQLIY